MEFLIRTLNVNMLTFHVCTLTQLLRKLEYITTFTRSLLHYNELLHNNIYSCSHRVIFIEDNGVEDSRCEDGRIVIFIKDCNGVDDCFTLASTIRSSHVELVRGQHLTIYSTCGRKCLSL